MLETLYYELSIAAARQSALITRAQATRLGADAAAIDRLSEAKLLREIDDDVFQLSSGPAALNHAYLYAAWLALAPERFRWERPQPATQDAVLSHHSAARLHGLGRIGPTQTAFTAPEAMPAPRAVVVHVDQLAPQDITNVGGIPVTTPHRTILDLVRYPYGRDEIGRVLQDALRLDAVALREVHGAMAPLAAEYGFPSEGAAFLGYFLPDLDTGTLSPRNLRAYAELAHPDDVAVIKARISDALYGIHPADDFVETLSEDVAAEIVGRLSRH